MFVNVPSSFAPVPPVRRKVYVERAKAAPEYVKVFPLAGVGWAINRADAQQDHVSDFDNKWNSDFAWSLGAGVSYDITQSIAADFSYQYLDLGEAKTGMSQFAPLDERFEGDLETHELKAGIRYSF